MGEGVGGWGEGCRRMGRRCRKMGRRVQDGRLLGGIPHLNIL